MLNNTAGTNGNEVYYNFDNHRFISDLNGVTKLLVALGTVHSLVPHGGSLSMTYTDLSIPRRTRALHYTHISPHTPLSGW